MVKALWNHRDARAANIATDLVLLGTKDAGQVGSHFGCVVVIVIVVYVFCDA